MDRRTMQTTQVVNTAVLLVRKVRAIAVVYLSLQSMERQFSE